MEINHAAEYTMGLNQAEDAKIRLGSGFIPVLSPHTTTKCCN